MGSMVQGHRAFTLIELLVVIAIVSILVGILVPAVSAFRLRASKVVCASNLRQVSMAIDSYKEQFGGRFPQARYMPQPFISGDDDPPLTELLSSHLAASTSTGQRVWRCPGDHDFVFARSGSSYMYQSELSGQTIEEFWPVQYMGVQPSQVLVGRDFDGGTFDVVDGQVTTPFFHNLRNLLFADGRVGNFE